MRHIIEEILVYTSPLVEARKKDLTNALMCILEPHIDPANSETADYIQKKIEQMNTVGIQFPDEGWLKRLATPMKVGYFHSEHAHRMY